MSMKGSPLLICGSRPTANVSVSYTHLDVYKRQMLLIGLGATDICAFGAKYMKAKKREQK